MTQTADNLTPTGIITAESLCLELRELISNRRAIDIMADRHECSYTDILLLIGATSDFNLFCAEHNRKHNNKPKTSPTKSDYDMRVLYEAGWSCKAIGETYKMAESTVYKRLKRCETTMRTIGRQANA